MEDLFKSIDILQNAIGRFGRLKIYKIFYDIDTITFTVDSDTYNSLEKMFDKPGEVRRYGWRLKFIKRSGKLCSTPPTTP